MTAEPVPPTNVADGPRIWLCSPQSFLEIRGMRFPIALLVVGSLLLSGFVAANGATDSSLHTFYGEVVAIDQARKVLQLKSGNQRFLFHYNDQTKITSTSGPVRLDRILRGTGAAVVMRVGEGNEGIALQIRFVPNANKDATLTLISARTVRGENVKGIAVSNFVDYQPPTDAWSGAQTFETRKNPGVFVLSLAPDGTVSNVTLRVSTGYPELDARGQRWLKKWRFRPNTFTEVQLPISYYYYRHY
jgi:TonB family protein